MPPRKKGPAPGTKGLAAVDVAGGTPTPDVVALCDQVVADGGAVLARYREPLRGSWLVLAALPLDKLAPTPFQRSLSATHAQWSG